MPMISNPALTLNLLNDKYPALTLNLLNCLVVNKPINGSRELTE